MPKSEKINTISKIDNDQYLENAEEPVETISEMTPPQVELTPEAARSILSQRTKFRKIAARLRFLKKRKNM